MFQSKGAERWRPFLRSEAVEIEELAALGREQEPRIASSIVMRAPGLRGGAERAPWLTSGRVGVSGCGSGCSRFAARFRERSSRSGSELMARSLRGASWSGKEPQNSLRRTAELPPPLQL